MNPKEIISTQLLIYEKTYEKTKDFEEFRTSVYNTILDIEKITPVSPFFSSYLFRVKLDCENMDRVSAASVILSLKTLMDRLN